ncbi:hypothetical protein [Desulfonema magnum]|uniref:Uncharacterized protein n=1 Tax=Desulfonema magnum TaxID=45655 RepID=A0A975BNN8_9BACT|nr:hypothetical protein [Desulfonema magnum]QTA88882.1 Uncharacterized protein dnm_049290 [Desulfonema magnum]
MFKIRIQVVFIIGIFMAGFFFSLPLFAADSEQTDIPPELANWKSWVLHDTEEQQCPTNYNNGQISRCTWPSRLNLFIESNRGRFEQEWLIFAKAWVPLPGSPKIWPGHVRLDYKNVPVMNRHSVPCIGMVPGEHRAEGIFEWSEMPEMIRIPPDIGLVNLFINNQPVASPVLDKNGQLWLQKQAVSQDEEDRLDVKIYRLLNDTIPMEVTTHLQLNISGRAREVRLEEVLLQNAIPMRLKSRLPARITPEHGLMIQARPGRWEIRILTRFESPVYEIGPVKGMFGQEIWSFKSQHHLRMTEIKGVSSVEPAQTDTPSEWRKFPAYIIQPGAKMILKEIRRGDPEPAPDRLNLHRIWWLDFDGNGFTIQDKITGTLKRQWYLSMNPPGILGRVSADGTDQLITVQADKKPGVELRRGELSLVADSRFDASARTVPAVGWDHDFQKVSGVMNLPPGWRVLTAQGVDVLPGTWFQRWTLLDFFIVLIIGISVLKLRSRGYGILALVTMVLIYHEPGAPRFVWLHLLAAMALLRVLPEGWIKKLVMLWGIGSVIVLLVAAIPFMVQQMRWGIYPQLELAREITRDSLSYSTKNEQYMSSESVPQVKSYSDSSSQWAKQEKSLYHRKQAVFKQDPNALIQTGPGLPAWKWRSVSMRWNGPVDKDQHIRLWLLSPFTNLVLSFLRVMLLGFFIFSLTDLRHWWQEMNKKLNPAVLTLAFLMLWGTFSNAESGARDANTSDSGKDSNLEFQISNFSPYPPKELLQELRDRLLEKPDCLPSCADCNRMELKVSPDSLQILLQIHAACETAVPLPGSSESWIPDEVFLNLNQQSAKALARDAEGLLWTRVPQGIHTITLMGKTGRGNSVQIPLPLKPHRAVFTSEGWDVQGIRENGTVETGIQLTRVKKNARDNFTGQNNTLPPFLHVERVLHLGLTWEISTTIRRLTPAGIPVVVSMPLIEGESVTTAGIHVEKGQAMINMDARAKEITWTSALDMSPEIRLQAPQSVPWTETWVLDASPIWHCETSGISVIHHQDEAGHWRPKWRPWPGESVQIEISRPKAIPGQLLTIDSAHLQWTPGQPRDKIVNKAGLTLKVRTSRGGQHEITLPEDAQLQLVKINDKSQPIRQEGQKVVIPLRPGSQKIYVEWYQMTSSSLLTEGPEIRIGEQAVNANVTFHMPRNRWILWTAGPRLGPAVLFWSYLFVVLLAALCLGKTTLTPLKIRHWLLLSLGLTQVSPESALLIVGWLLALGLRKKYMPPDHWFFFNGIQLGLTGWTLAAFIALYEAIRKGLLGIPRMQISGNGSGNFYLHWTQDRIEAMMPQPQVFSLPQWVFHLLMLLWSLWLAISLLKWLGWGWNCFIQGKIWRKVSFRRQEQPPPLKGKKC